MHTQCKAASTSSAGQAWASVDRLNTVQAPSCPVNAQIDAREGRSSLIVHPLAQRCRVVVIPRELSPLPCAWPSLCAPALHACLPSLPASSLTSATCDRSLASKATPAARNGARACILPASTIRRPEPSLSVPRRASAHTDLGTTTSAPLDRAASDARRGIAGNAQTLSSMIDPLNTRTASAPPEKTPDVEAADNGKRLVQRQPSLNGSRPCVPSLSRAASLIIPLTRLPPTEAALNRRRRYSKQLATPSARRTPAWNRDDGPRLHQTAAGASGQQRWRKSLAVDDDSHNADAVRLPRTHNINTTARDVARARRFRPAPPPYKRHPSRATIASRNTHTHTARALLTVPRSRSARSSRYLSTGLCASLRAQPGDCILLPPVLQSGDEDADGLHRRAARRDVIRTPRDANTCRSHIAMRTCDTTFWPPPASPPAYLGAVILPDADGRPRRRAHPPRLPAASPHIARHPHRSGGDARVARSVPARSMLRPRVRILAFAPFADVPQPGAEERHTAAVADTIELSRRLGAQQNTSSRALQHVYSSERPSACPGSVPALCTTPPPPSSGLMRTPGPQPHKPRATVGGVADGARARAQSPALGQDALPIPSRAPAAAAALLQMHIKV
ncbi:hypothetical protein POSPLADRAFT_1061892 [Postia placenta MAD-698-R-SB12]|uniref:Uncharacterized protein n=1 Tax=Postia placenta MAD-698-R-SB12 TaxID=670580 RepID=A0A1X6MM03_9APHY|nr:hypothetical protein POSPLADRAFT_1061892 [Postia placenta MAD-698-R-SB12]OSX57192.1 hypothetical protein POSPLADRAFT_1061892 [Postia placenta MAD-698-R-SB12]